MPVDRVHENWMLIKIEALNATHCISTLRNWTVGMCSCFFLVAISLHESPLATAKVGNRVLPVGLHFLYLILIFGMLQSFGEKRSRSCAKS